VLYADSAGLDSESINLEALETLVRVSGMAVELLSVSRVAPKREAQESSAIEEAAVEEASASAPQITPSGPEEVSSSYTPAREYEEPSPVTAVEESSFAESTQQTESFEPEAPPMAAISEEESAVSQSEPASVEAQQAPLGTRRRYGMDAELPVEVYSDDERRLHNDARRFARLLISEIKLYNEQKVTEGRSQNDLYDRLREYIDRSREMYDKRVKAEVAARYDYFHGELVSTLAEGDPSKLGSNYPGATVTA
jgi:hypothetical protein